MSFNVQEKRSDVGRWDCCGLLLAGMVIKKNGLLQDDSRDHIGMYHIPD